MARNLLQGTDKRVVCSYETNGIWKKYIKVLKHRTVFIWYTTASECGEMYNFLKEQYWFIYVYSRWNLCLLEYHETTASTGHKGKCQGPQDANHWHLLNCTGTVAFCSIRFERRSFRFVRNCPIVDGGQEWRVTEPLDQRPMRLGGQRENSCRQVA